MEQTKGVKKGAWTHEEDNLLRACIHKYGVGKWHLVPERAGLNRCRKSCRLRWLNYLSPNIKRGSFTEDEVDLILRLHRLLKNRWSLIAGRLPGRTANDVKNYWHTRLSKKVASYKKGKEKHEENAMKTQEVIKPQPRTFSINHHLPLLEKKHNFANNDGGVRVCAAPKEDNNALAECDVGDADCTAAACDEKLGSWSLLSDQDVDSILEFPNMEDFHVGGPSISDTYWDSNLRDFELSIWNI